MFMRHRFSNVNRRQQHKDVRLNKRNEDVQPQKHHRNRNWKQREKDQSHHVARKHIGEQTYGERQDSRQMAEYLNRKQQWSYERFGTQKVLHVPKAVPANALEVVIEPGDQRA